MEDFLKAYSEKVLEDAKRNLNVYRNVNGKRRRSTNTGKLRDSLEYKIGEKGVEFTGEDYGLIVEGGRRAGARQPPTEPIEKWIKEKGIRVRDRNGKFIESTQARIKSMAYLIARSIGRKGIQPTYFLSNALEKNIPLIEDEIVNDLEIMVEKWITDGNNN